MCYQTVEGDLLSTQAQAIGEAMKRAARASTSNGAQFFLNADQSRLSYLDNGSAAGGFVEDLPASAQLAEKSARQFVMDINRALGNAGILGALKVAALIPDALVLLGAALVYDSEGQTPDHWRCSFRPTLHGGDSTTDAPVLDAQVEIQIGARGTLLGFVAQWRPITQSFIASPMAAPDPKTLDWTAQSSERDGTDDTDAVDSGTPQLVYALAKSSGGATQLLPYHVFQADPLERRYPAAQGVDIVLPETSTQY